MSGTEPASSGANPGRTGVPPQRLPGWSKRLLALAAGSAVIGVVGALACRAAVGWVYPIGSGSMEPALMTGESVFLFYGSAVEKRFDIVAYRDEGGGASIKRAFGLPFETFLVDQSGDVRVNHKYVPEGPGRPAPTLIFDSHLQSIEEHWRHGGNVVDPWTMEDATVEGEPEVWAMNGDLVPRGSDLGLLRFRDRVTDGALGPDGLYVAGPNIVHDVVVEFEVQVVSAGGYLRVQLCEENDIFRVTIPLYEGESSPRAVLQRIMPRIAGGGPAQVVIGSMLAPVPVGEWVRVRMSNIDNRVSLGIGDSRFHVDYDQNTRRRNPATGRDAPFSVGERVKLGGSGIDLRVRNLRVLRDFHVTSRGKFAVGQEITLGADEFFVLGDNSRNSSDSRERGPIPSARIMGTAKAVVRPLGAFRKL